MRRVLVASDSAAQGQMQYWTQCSAPLHAVHFTLQIIELPFDRRLPAQALSQLIEGPKAQLTLKAASKRKSTEAMILMCPSWDIRCSRGVSASKRPNKSSHHRRHVRGSRPTRNIHTQSAMQRMENVASEVELIGGRNNALDSRNDKSLDFFVGAKSATP